MYQNIHLQRLENKRVAIHVWDDKTGYKRYPYRPYAYMKNPNGDLQTIYGDNVRKVTQWTTWDMDNGRIFESDVSPVTRTLVDLYYESDEPSTGHRIIFFDIETDDTDSWPSVEDADNEVTAISLYDQVLDEYYVWILDKDHQVTYEGYDNVVVIPCNNERILLESFLEKWNEIQPTIVSGWSIDKYDIPYMYRRISKVLGEPIASTLSPIGQVVYNKYRQRYFIGGVSCLDYIELYKRFTFTQLHSYALDVVAHHELGRGKVKYEKGLRHLFQENIKKFIEYNLVDTQLVVDLDKKLNFIELVRGICHKGHVALEDVYYSSRWIEGAILTFTKRQGVVSPNKKPYDRNAMGDDAEEKFSGAYVKSPEGGKYRWLYDLDFTSLYPSLIITQNISPETKIGIVKLWDANDYVAGKIEELNVEIMGELSVLSREDFQQVMNENNLSISANGIIYRHDKKGLVPLILEEWYKDKDNYDQLMKEYGKKGNKDKSRYYRDRRTIAKTMLNSVYGVLGLPSFRFYDLDNAAAVTTSGVLLIKFAEKMANYYYNNKLKLETKNDYCVYIDTDSIFMETLPLIQKLNPDIQEDDEIEKEVLKLATNVQDYLNNSFDMFASRFLHCQQHNFSIKQEVIAKTGIWTTKKRYALHIVNDNGIPKDEIDVKGLDVKRSNFPLAFRVFLKDLLWNDFLKDTSKEEVDRKILEFKNHIRELPVGEIATPTGCKGIDKYADKQKKQLFGNWKKGSPAHVKAAITYNEMLKYLKLYKKYDRLRSGDKIRWMYLKQNPYGLKTIAMRGYEDPPEILDFINTYIDYKKVFDKVLMSKLEDFYTALKWGFPSASQSIIDEFFV